MTAICLSNRLRGAALSGSKPMPTNQKNKTLQTRAACLAGIALAMAAFPAIASAQMTGEMEGVKPTLEEQVKTVDRDSDMSLDPSEFRSYVIYLADHGNESAADILIADDYETVFAEHDANSDGLLSVLEVKQFKMSLMKTKANDMSPMMDDNPT